MCEHVACSFLLLVQAQKMRALALAYCSQKGLPGLGCMTAEGHHALHLVLEDLRLNQADAATVVAVAEHLDPRLLDRHRP